MADKAPDKVYKNQMEKIEEALVMNILTTRPGPRCHNPKTLPELTLPTELFYLVV